jgi:hypothetical protein
MFKKILDFLRYPSTWKGIVTAVGILGVKVAPDQAEAIVTAAVSIVAAISTFFSDSDVKPA